MKAVSVGKKVRVGNGTLTVIAGPCVAESADICMRIAEHFTKLSEKLKFQYIFKASFDKANRSSIKSFRGIGTRDGLKMLELVRNRFDAPVLTDVHETGHVSEVGALADVIQIPAFLCRQTDLLLAAGNTKKPVNIKKGQFMAPEDMKGAVEKVASVGNENAMLTERGTSFGYHNLVVDMRGLVIMREFGVPVIFDATHSVQLPGGLGNASGGQKQFVPALARAAVAVGVDGLFLEAHPEPEKALSDGPNSLDFEESEKLLTEIMRTYGTASQD